MRQSVGCGRLVGFATAAFVLGVVLKALAQAWFSPSAVSRVDRHGCFQALNGCAFLSLSL
jgi:hypothetical protein